MQAHHAPMMEELLAAANRVIRSGRYILGGEGEALEKETAAALGMKEAVNVASGTDALVVLLMALGIGPGDEVVTTPFTFFATAGSIARLGARPVFVDVERDTLNMDPAKATAALGPKTKAVMTVHLFGRVARVDGLKEACDARGIPLLEDAAQSIGARAGANGPAVGKLGLAATLSYFPAKNLGCLGDGGAVITDDAELARKLRILRVHGSEQRYFHQMIGGNFRLDEIQAAFLRVKLPHLRSWVEARRALAGRYRKNLEGAALPIGLPPDDAGCVWNQFVIRVRDGKRDALMKRLADKGIGSAIYYPLPLHLQTCFAYLGHGKGDFPVTEQACDEVLALPIYPELPPAAVDQVCEELIGFFR